MFSLVLVHVDILASTTDAKTRQVVITRVGCWGGGSERLNRLADGVIVPRVTEVAHSSERKRLIFLIYNPEQVGPRLAYQVPDTRQWSRTIL